MQKIIYTNSRGDSVTIGHNPPFQLASIEGLGDLDADIQTSKAAYQDGSTYLDALLNERTISIGFRIKEDSIEDLFELRRRVASIFNPKFGLGELRYEYPGGVKVINAVADHVPTFPSGGSNHGPTFQRSMITLICPDPYWRDIESISKPMSAIEPRFSFPLKFPVEFGSEGSRQVYDNIGDVPAPVLIEFRGPATNPKVINETTGEFIQLNRILGPDDRLFIDTSIGNKTVEIVDGAGNRTNVFNWLDVNSTLFDLELGENTISYVADDGRENAIVQITYQNRYVGI